MSQSVPLWTSNHELDICVQWMECIPFSSRYKVFFKSVLESERDGDPQSFQNFEEFIVYALVVMLDHYVSSFLGNDMFYETFSDIGDAKTPELAKCENIFSSSSICEALYIEEEEMRQAFEHAQIYHESEASISGSTFPPQISTLLDIYTEVSKNGSVLDGYTRSNGEVFTNREFVESLDKMELQLQLQMKNSGKLVTFKPVNILNNYSSESWQIGFNELFVKHYVVHTTMPIL